MSKGREGSDHRPNSQLPDDGNPEVMPPGLVPRSACIDWSRENLGAIGVRFVLCTRSYTDVHAAVLLITGDGDTRVAPLHARKMAALLQAATDSNRPQLLLYDTKSGHSGGRPINKIIEENTDILSFLFWQLGVPAN